MNALTGEPVHQSEPNFRPGIVKYLRWRELRHRLREFVEPMEDCDFRRQAFELLNAERHAAPNN